MDNNVLRIGLNNGAVAALWALIPGILILTSTDNDSDFDLLLDFIQLMILFPIILVIVSIISSQNYSKPSEILANCTICCISGGIFFNLILELFFYIAALGDDTQYELELSALVSINSIVKAILIGLFSSMVVIMNRLKSYEIKKDEMVDEKKGQSIDLKGSSINEWEDENGLSWKKYEGILYYWDGDDWQKHQQLLIQDGITWDVQFEQFVSRVSKTIQQKGDVDKISQLMKIEKMFEYQVTTFMGNDNDSFSKCVFYVHKIAKLATSESFTQFEEHEYYEKYKKIQDRPVGLTTKQKQAFFVLSNQMLEILEF